MNETIVERIKKKFNLRNVNSQRRHLASTIRNTRLKEKGAGYSFNRGMDTVEKDGNRSEGYVEIFMGLTYLFEEVRKLGKRPLVLDIGAGTTRGISEISQSPLGEGLDFMATGLVWHDEIKKYIGRDRFRETSVEALKGIEKNSVTCVLGLNSVTYSEQPSLVAKRIDEVLVPNGFVKITGGPDSRRGMHKPDRIRDEFRKLGYDTAIFRNRNLFDILVAVKPGSENSPSAKDVLIKDEKLMLQENGIDMQFGV